MRNDDDQPRHRRLRFVPGLEPGPEFTASELGFEEICERYIDQQRTRADEIRNAVRRDGDGDQAATPALPDDEPDQARPRRRPGVR